MTAEAIKNNPWQGENDLALFKSSVPIGDQQIWHEFYQLHKEKIQVKKESIAVEKLAIIIKATFKLSDQKGFSLMSLRDLSQATQMSMGSLYSYIGSKGQLAEMIHQFLPYIFDRCIGEQLSIEQSTQQQLNILIRGHIFITECLQPWFFFAFMETKHLSRRIKQLAKDNELRSERLLEKIIKRGEQEGLFIQTNPFLCAMMIKGLLQNWYVKRTKFKHQSIGSQQYIRFVDQLITSYLVQQNEL